MKGIYFEEKGLALLKQRGITKSEFARRMGIQRQNVNVLFKTNNLEIIARAAEVLEVPLALLVSYVDEPDVSELSVLNTDEGQGDWVEISPEDVPMGTSVEDIENRRQIISKFYHDWKLRNPSLKKFNLSLNEDINIRFVSITETCTHASRTYLSTLAVLQLDAILTNAKVVSIVSSKNNSNQKPFEKIIIMRYYCVGIGLIKMTVGVRRRTHEKVQYCITALEIEKDAKKASI
jgi:transcriptional regulator with XRE-family HTH domain